MKTVSRSKCFTLPLPSLHILFLFKLTNFITVCLNNHCLLMAKCYSLSYLFSCTPYYIIEGWGLLKFPRDRLIIQASSVALRLWIFKWSCDWQGLHKDKANPAAIPPPFLHSSSHFSISCYFSLSSWPCTLLPLSCICSKQAVQQKKLVTCMPKGFINLCAFKPPEQVESEQPRICSRIIFLKISNSLFKALLGIFIALFLI